MSRHSSRLAIQSRPTPRTGRSFTAAYAGAALTAPRSRPSHWKSVLRPLPLALWVPLALAAWCVPMAHAAGPLPQGGAFVRGQGAIISGTASLTIDQSSSRGVIDWHSFSIGNGNTVAFNNGSGATLNRVTGGDPSSILGKLTATGSLYVINPQGIVVGPSGVVSTAGRFVASTLDICNDDFMNSGNSLTLSGKSDASVINLGRISSSGGDVFLIARHAVVNAGTVNAPGGTVELAAGETVLLQDSASSRQVLVQTGSHGSVVNDGRIKAAQVSLQAADGNVYALAGGGTRIRATGTATRDGHVWLIADSGLVRQQGKIAATNADGSGGTVDTQAAQLAFGKYAVVSARQWNLSTPAFTIDGTAARTLQRSLSAGTSVDITTTGGNGATGDLGIARSLRWHGPASLTLAAYRNVFITGGTTIANDGAGNLTLRADKTGIDNGGSVSNLGTIDWSSSAGIVSLLYDMNGRYSPGTLLGNASWTAPAYSGLVTQITAYKLVNSLTDLQDISLDLAGNYALGKDIDASATILTSTPSSGVDFIPLGSAATPFTGQFDGMGHVIDRFSQNEIYSPSGTKAIGLFGEIGTAGVVRNVGITNTAFYEGQDDILDNVPIVITFGILAGRNRGLITYAYTSGYRGATHYGNAPIGGLVGTNDGLIERSSSSATVGDAGDAGGLVGANLGRIVQSFATGQVVTQTFGSPGGLVGVNSGTISQSYATSYVLGLTAAGGLAYANSGLIEQSFASGNVPTPSYQGPFFQPVFGGIVAYGARGTLASNVYWDKETTTQTASTGDVSQLPASNGLTTSQMSNPSSFDASWDFSPTGVWVMPAGATHPILRWQLGQ